MPQSFEFGEEYTEEQQLLPPLVNTNHLVLPDKAESTKTVLPPYVQMGAGNGVRTTTRYRHDSTKSVLPPYSTMPTSITTITDAPFTHESTEMSLLEDENFPTITEYLNFCLRYYQTYFTAGHVALGPVTRGMNINGDKVVNSIQPTVHESSFDDYNQVEEGTEGLSTSESLEHYVDGMRSFLNTVAEQGGNVFDYCDNPTMCDAVLYTVGGAWVDIAGHAIYITKHTLDDLVELTLAKSGSSTSAYEVKTAFYGNVELVPPYFVPPQEIDH